jgi:hypothetical protein
VEKTPFDIDGTCCVAAGPEALEVCALEDLDVDATAAVAALPTNR